VDSSKQAHWQHEKYPPQVHPDGRVTFRLEAPLARKVQIEPLNGKPENNGYNGLGKAPYDMTKDENGIWSVTTPPAVPGLHNYWLVVDGARVNDTVTKSYGGKMKCCGVEVPEPGVDFYDIKDVPHGQVRMQWYYSKVTNLWRRAYVYVPPEYDNSPEQRYPVFILRHGGGEDETSWVEQGRANFIMDNLIAEGKAKPFIIVMDNGTWRWPENVPRPKPGERPSGPWPPKGWADGFMKTLLEDIIPMIDTNYRTLADQSHRAMAGLSMGGMQTRVITLAHPDMFSYVGMFSGGSISLDDINNAPGFKEKVKLVFISYGSRELENPRMRLFGDPKENIEALKKAGMNTHFYVSPLTAHEWQSWRRGLHEFAPLLFKD